MKRPLLIAYQLLTGLSDMSTGLLLIAAPALTLRLMRLHPAADALLFLSYLGVFVLSVGLACLYGAWLALERALDRLEVVWLLTGVTRGLVAVFIVAKLTSGALERGWSSVAISDGALALIQFVGLGRGWLRNVPD